MAGPVTGVDAVLNGSRQWHVEQSDVLAGLRALPDGCVSVVCTSPPYWGLRAYGTNPQVWGGDPACEHEWGTHLAPRRHDLRNGQGASTLGEGNRIDQNLRDLSERQQVATCARCTAWRGELGSEPTPALFVEHMVQIFREVRRVLHPTGCLFLNVGDSYAGSGKGPTGHNGLGDQEERQGFVGRGARMGSVHGEWGHTSGVKPPPSLKAKDLIGIPWELAFALRADGWWLRSEITWIKTSCMPESVQGWRWERHKVRTTHNAHEIALQERMAKMGANRNSAGVTGNPETRAAERDGMWTDCPGCLVCNDNDGLVLRKGSGRPTSATESMFLFAANDSYYYDCEAVKTPHSPATVDTPQRQRMIAESKSSRAAEFYGALTGQRGGVGERMLSLNESGANARNYLILGPEPLREEHYAAYPSAIPEFAIKAGSSEKGVCSACLAPWARVVERERNGLAWISTKGAVTQNGGKGTERLGPGISDISTTTGWRPTCRCSSGLMPSLVLDPFAGSCTTGIVALRLGRRFLGFDLNPKYVEMGRRRITNDCPMFNSEAAS